MGVWAGDDSPSKRDRQPSLFAYTLLAVSEAVASYMSWTTTTGLLAYTSLQTLSTLHLARIIHENETRSWDSLHRVL